MFKPKTTTATATTATTAPKRGFGIEDFMAGLAGVSAGNRAKFWTAGIYSAEVVKTFLRLSERKDQIGHVKCGIVARVVEVHASYPAEPPAGPSLVVGDIAGSFINLTMRGENGLRDWKNILLALARCDNTDLVESEITAEDWREAYTLDTPEDTFEGYRLRIDVSRTRKASPDGKGDRIYDNPSWAPIGPPEKR